VNRLVTQLVQQIQTQNGISDHAEAELLSAFVMPFDPKQSKERNQLLIVKSTEEEDVFLGVQFTALIHEYLKKFGGGAAVMTEKDFLSSSLSIIIEELSHLVYAHYHLSQEHALSQLELEVQGEIDRFVAFCQMTEAQGFAVSSDDIHRWLFEKFEMQAHAAAQTERYQEAHALSKKLCAVISINGVRGQATEELLQKIFRLHGHEKLQFISQFRAA
jgi:hypothetical protein